MARRRGTAAQRQRSSGAEEGEKAVADTARTLLTTWHVQAAVS
jgi:hypothetical protein